MIRIIYSIRLFLVVILFVNIFSSVDISSNVSNVNNKSNNYLNLTQMISKETITEKCLEEIIDVLQEKGDSEEVRDYLKILKSLSPRMALLLENIEFPNQLLPDKHDFDNISNVSFINLPIKKFLNFSELILNIAISKRKLLTKEDVIKKVIKVCKKKDIDKLEEILGDNEYLKVCIEFINIIALHMHLDRRGVLRDEFSEFFRDIDLNLGNWFKEVAENSRYGQAKDFNGILTRMIIKDKYGIEALIYLLKNSDMIIRNTLYKLDVDMFIIPKDATSHYLTNAIFTKIHEILFFNTYNKDIDKNILKKILKYLARDTTLEKDYTIYREVKKELKYFYNKRCIFDPYDETNSLIHNLDFIRLTDYRDSKNIAFLRGFLGKEFVEEIISESMEVKSLSESYISNYVTFVMHLDSLFEKLDDHVYIEEIGRYFRDCITLGNESLFLENQKLYSYVLGNFSLNARYFSKFGNDIRKEIDFYINGSYKYYINAIISEKKDKIGVAKYENRALIKMHHYNIGGIKNEKYKRFSKKIKFSNLRVEKFRYHFAAISLLLAEIYKMDKSFYKSIIEKLIINEDQVGSKHNNKKAKQYMQFISCLSREENSLEKFEQKMKEYIAKNKLPVFRSDLTLSILQTIILEFTSKYERREKSIARSLQHIYQDVLKKVDKRGIIELREKFSRVKDNKLENIVRALDDVIEVKDDEKMDIFLQGVFKGTSHQELKKDKLIREWILNLTKEEYDLSEIERLGNKYRESLLGAFILQADDKFETELFLKLFLKDLSENYKTVEYNFEEFKKEDKKRFEKIKKEDEEIFNKLDEEAKKEFDKFEEYIELDLIEYYATNWFNNNIMYGKQINIYDELDTKEKDDVVSIATILNNPITIFYIVNTAKSLGGFEEEKLLKKIKDFIEVESGEIEDVFLGLLMSEKPEIFQLFYENPELEEYIIYTLLDEEPNNSLKAPRNDISEEIRKISKVIKNNEYLKERFLFFYEKHKMPFHKAVNLAACLGHLERLEFLVELGVDINYKYETAQETWYSNKSILEVIVKSLSDNFNSYSDDIVSNVIGFGDEINLSISEMNVHHRKVIELLVKNGANKEDLDGFNKEDIQPRAYREDFSSEEERKIYNKFIEQQLLRHVETIKHLEILKKESMEFEKKDDMKQLKNSMDNISYKVKSYVIYVYEQILKKDFPVELEDILNILTLNRVNKKYKSNKTFLPTEIRLITRILIAA